MPHSLDGVAMVSVYCTDLHRSLAFYRDAIGLDPQPMGNNGAYCEFGPEPGHGFYLVGNRPPLPASEARTARTTFTFAVASAADTFAHLRAHGVEVIQDEPMDMGGGMYWFEALDPDGLTLEFLGG